MLRFQCSLYIVRSVINQRLNSSSRDDGVYNNGVQDEHVLQSLRFNWYPCANLDDTCEILIDEIGVRGAAYSVAYWEVFSPGIKFKHDELIIEGLATQFEFTVEIVER